MAIRRLSLVLVLLAAFALARMTVNAQSVNPPQAPQMNAVPFEFDPQHLEVVAAEWKGGIGCLETFDPVCLVSNDPQDKFVAGLLLAKSGLTAQNASAGAS